MDDVQVRADVEPASDGARLHQEPAGTGTPRSTDLLQSGAPRCRSLVSLRQAIAAARARRLPELVASRKPRRPLRCALPIRATKPKSSSTSFDRNDRAAMRDGIRAVRKLYSTGPLGDLVKEELKPGPLVTSDADLDTYLRSSLDLDHHPVGTCAMGTGPDAVVDPELKAARPRRSQDCRCLGDAAGPGRKHKCADGYGRREGSRI